MGEAPKVGVPRTTRKAPRFQKQSREFERIVGLFGQVSKRDFERKRLLKDRASGRMCLWAVQAQNLDVPAVLPFRTVSNATLGRGSRDATLVF